MCQSRGRTRSRRTAIVHPGAFDPDKFDFYAMDCYRRMGEDAMATVHAREVIRKSTSPDGSLRSPMRISEAHTTLAVVSARDGDLDGAVEAGGAALDIPRRSIPSLLMVSGDLVAELRQTTAASPLQPSTSNGSTLWLARTAVPLRKAVRAPGHG